MITCDTGVDYQKYGFRWVGHAVLQNSKVQVDLCYKILLSIFHKYSNNDCLLITQYKSKILQKAL